MDNAVQYFLGKLGLNRYKSSYKLLSQKIFSLRESICGRSSWFLLQSLMFSGYNSYFPLWNVISISIQAIYPFYLQLSFTV